MADEFELEALRRRLSEIRAGDITITETVTSESSPFAGGLIWQQTNKHMYADDAPQSGGRSNLSDSLIREVALSPHLRPMVPPDLADELQRKLHRTAPGYAPSSPQELLDWLKERLLVPEKEWEELVDSMTADPEGDMDDFLSGIRNKVCMVSLPGAEMRCVTALESLPLLAGAFGLTLNELNLLSFDEETDEPALRKKAEKALRSDADREGFSLSDFLAQWISYYAPVSLAFIGGVTGFRREDILPDLERLLEEDALVMDLLVEGRGEEICDRENLEILLRMHRSRQRPAFGALDIRYLQVFLADHQGLTRRSQEMGGLQRGLESLFGYPAPAALWEEHVFPARLSPYYGSWLDSLMNTSGLAWFGCGREKISFAFPEELGLFIPAGERRPEELSDVTELFPSLHGAFTMDDIYRHSGLRGREILPRLWSLVWKGLAGASSFEAVRRGVHDSFGGPDRPGRSRPDGFTRMMNRWDAMGPERMRWHAMTAGEGSEPDLLREAAMNRERVRLLLRRYGIIFRELLERELPPLRWKNLFRTIRLMELSGEIVSGYFFTGIPGLQFMSHEAFRSLQRVPDDDSFCWMNAADPASLCGLKMESLKNRLPARKASTLLAFRGPHLVMEARKSGRDITMNCEPGSDLARRCFSVFRDLISRDFNAPGSITVEFINGAGAATGPFRDDLAACGFRADYKTMTLFRSYS
jgi:ATP-dependent Lhr-like helicase